MEPIKLTLSQKLKKYCEPPFLKLNWDNTSCILANTVITQMFKPGLGQ